MLQIDLRLAGAAVLAVTMWTGLLFAQEPTVPADPPPAGSPEIVPEKMEPPPQGDPGAGQESLSEELAPTGGVIKPPEQVDPGMVEPPPDGGAAVTPIIPPPPPEPESD
jgi:hypothetical protein